MRKSSIHTLTMDRHDGCAEFDERLLENAFAPTLDAELDTHLARCARCRCARDLYLTTADALSVALSTSRAPSPSRAQSQRERELPDQAESRRDPESADSRAILATSTAPVSGPKRFAGARKHWKTLAYTLSAASILVAAAWLAHLNSTHQGDLSIVSTGGDARVEFTEAHQAMLRQGTADFEVQGGEASVDTPLGSVRAKDARFRITTSLSKESPEMNRPQAAILVTVLVTSGVAWWSSKDERDVRIGAGETLVRPEPSAPPVRSSDIELEPTRASSSGPTRVDASAPSEGPQAKDMRVIGRVLDDVTGLPLDDSDVRFRVLSDGTRLIEADGTSSADGSFTLGVTESEVTPASASISDLMPGAPYLIVTHAGYAPLHDGSPKLKRSLIQWKPGTPVDLGEVRLKHGARVNGRVIDENGQPVAGAVLLLRTSSGEGEAYSTSYGREIGRTDGSGRMVISELLRPAVGDENFLLMAVTDHGMGWTRLVVVPGRDAVDAEIRLAAQAGLDVTVVDEHQVPIAGAKVRAIPCFQPFSESSPDVIDPGWPGTSTHLAALFAQATDATGHARFDHLVRSDDGWARYGILAESDGFATARVKDLFIARTLATAEQRIMLQRKRAWSISGRVLDENARPVEGAIVRLTSGLRGAAFVSTPSTETSTDRDGTYRLIDLDPDLVRVSLSAQFEGYPDTPRYVERPNIADVDGVDILLARAAPIDGLIVDESDSPVAGARVGIQQSQRNYSQTTGADGRFAFPDAIAGDWRAWVFPPEPRDDWQWPDDTELRGGTHSAVLRLHRLKGTFTRVNADVIDAETGELLDPAAAMILPLVRQPRGIQRKIEAVRSRGRVTMERVEGGDWRLWVAVKGRGAAYADVHVSGGEREVFAQVRLGQPGSISGRVRLEDMPAGETLQVSAMLAAALYRPGGPEWEQGASWDASSTPSSTGEFRLDRLIPGRWRVRISGKSVHAYMEVDVHSGAETRADIQADLGSTLMFRATAGLPATRLELTIQRTDRPSEPQKYLVDLGDGHYENRILIEPATYHWIARFLNGEYDDQPFEVADSQSGDVSITAGAVTSVIVPFVAK